MTEHGSARPRLAGRLTATGLLALVMLVVAFGMPQPSGATYVSGSRVTATVRAASDWTPPTVAVRALPSTVQGVVSLVADASDAETGVRDVAIQVTGPGTGSGTGWTTVCTTATSPYACSWDTRAVADGSWSVRAVATDRANYTTTSATRVTTVANHVLVTLGAVSSVVRGTVPLTATIHGAGTTAYAVRIEYAPAGTTTWRTVCTRSAAPYSCDWATTSVTGGDYDLRAVATSGGTSHASATVADVLVDNSAPTVTLQDPGSPLRGSVVFSTTAGDADSGLARVAVQYAASGSVTFTELCTTTTEPWSCSADTTRIADGSYTFRAVATDVAGNVTTSVTVGNRVVDNTVSSVSVTDPGQYLSGTVTLTASASSTAGVTSVRIQRAATGTSTWSEVCTDTTAPYSCAWSTTTVADGSYDLRAVLVDGTGRTTISTVVVARRVDNNPVRGVDVQTVSGGVTAGKVDSGDRMTFLYTEELNLASISAGWTGSPLSVTLRLRDGNLLGLGNKGDTVDVQLNGTVLNLGSVNLREDYIKSNRSAVLAATLTASTTTLNGAPATLLTLTVGQNGQSLRTVSLVSAMVWTPSAAATDRAGRPASNAPVVETGAADREF